MDKNNILKRLSPTPWKHEIDNCGIIHYRVFDRHKMLVAAYVAEKDAPIISAAPEMLVTLFATQQFISNLPDNIIDKHLALKQINEVISKATGE